MSDAAPVIPTGAALVGSYGQGVAPAGYGPGGRALVASDARRVSTGTAYKPPFEVDPKHCHHVEGEKQCMSWPVQKNENPQRLCAGHLKKALKADAADTPADQGLRTNES